MHGKQFLESSTSKKILKASSYKLDYLHLSLIFRSRRTALKSETWHWAMLTCCAQHKNSSNFEELFLYLICTFSHNKSLKDENTIYNCQSVHQQQTLALRKFCNISWFSTSYSQSKYQTILYIHITNHLYRPTCVGSMFQR